MIITVSHVISMGHRLPSYKGICSSPHGHNVRVEVVIDSHNKFLDFKKVSDSLKFVLEPLDHAMVLHTEDPLLPILRDMNFRTYAITVEPTTEAIAWEIFSKMDPRFWELMSVTVHETDKYSATCRQSDFARAQL